jgi:hypothetical protein
MCFCLFLFVYFSLNFLTHLRFWEVIMSNKKSNLERERERRRKEEGHGQGEGRET